MKIASIDIGTNTCNLLVAELNSTQKLVFIHRDKKAITLINNKDYTNNNISSESISNLINVINIYKDKISELGAEKIIVTATSGIRSANNKDQVLNAVKNETGIDIDLINGQREAELVFTGVKNAVNFNEQPALIIDIGGGSIEFIIAKSSEIIYKESFQIGAARLLNKYRFADPLTVDDIYQINSILKANLTELFDNCKSLNIKNLIGASGSYETFADLIKYEFDVAKIRDTDAFNTIDLDYFNKIHNKLIRYNFEERKNMPGMEIIRVKLIPLASVITKYIIDELNINLMIQSNFSIKEGLIFDYLYNN